MTPFADIYRGRRVLITGDTGFKGAWLALWLQRLGAEVHGLALPPESERFLFARAALAETMSHRDCDVRDVDAVRHIVAAVRPQLVLHLAAQALVRRSYRDPVATMATNVMGTVHLCEALRRLDAPCAAVIVSSDKCYENQASSFGYREIDPMGGDDPYSASKGCTELLVAAWRRAFFSGTPGLPIASARAGNVFGPGDRGEDRIVPDAIGAFERGETLRVRNPRAVRPWQHVLEPLSGYLWLGAKLLGDDPRPYCKGWNFGPTSESWKCVAELIDGVIAHRGGGEWHAVPSAEPFHETQVLHLAIDRAVSELGWRPLWSFEQALAETVSGYRELAAADSPASVRAIVARQIARYEHTAAASRVAWAEGDR